MSLKFIDLFAGIGGFHRALADLGYKCELTCEIDPECKIVYQANFPESKRPGRFYENIRTLTRKDIDEEDSYYTDKTIDKKVFDHDILCAGFPCQPFSKSGHQQGFKDRTRGTLFFDIMAIVHAKQPTYLFLENVRNLAGPRHTDTWAEIVTQIEAAGYDVIPNPLVASPHNLPPQLGGAPQVRDRVFILAIKKSQKKLHLLKAIHAAVSSGDLGMNWDKDDWRISDLIIADKDLPNVESYRLKENELAWVEAWDYLVQNLDSDSLPGFPMWEEYMTPTPQLRPDMPDWEENFMRKNCTFYNDHAAFIDNWRRMKWGAKKIRIEDFPPSRRKFEWQARKWYPKKKGRTLEDLVLQFRPSGIRVKPPTYLPALVAITQTSIIGPKAGKGIKTYRTLSPFEAAALQGMPADTFKKAGVSDKAAYKQLGNAVNVGIIRHLAALLTGKRKLGLASQEEFPV
jgi:DNA (cytosine-5)-methyltransferase 1